MDSTNVKSASAPTDMAAVAQSRVQAQLAADGTPAPTIPASTWLAIFNAVLTAIQQCRAAKAAAAAGTTGTAATQAVADTLAQPTLFQQVKLRRLLIQHMGRPSFRSYGDKVMGALLHVGASASSQDRLAFVTQAVDS